MSSVKADIPSLLITGTMLDDPVANIFQIAVRNGSRPYQQSFVSVRTRSSKRSPLQIKPIIKMGTLSLTTPEGQSH
jgi:hypothetical protein